MKNKFPKLIPIMVIMLIALACAQETRLNLVLGQLLNVLRPRAYRDRDGGQISPGQSMLERLIADLEAGGNSMVAEVEEFMEARRERKRIKRQDLWVKRQLEPPYVNFEEAFAAFCAGTISWSRTIDGHDGTQRRFFALVAQACSKEESDIRATDFKTNIMREGRPKRSAIGLLRLWEKRPGLKGNEAVAEMKKNFGVADFAPPVNKTAWREKSNNWGKVITILNISRNHPLQNENEARRLLSSHGFKFTPEVELAMALEVQAGNKAAVDAFVLNYEKHVKRLAAYIAKRYTGVSEDDIIQAGMVYVMNRVQWFDLGRGTKFITYLSGGRKQKGAFTLLERVMRRFADTESKKIRHTNADMGERDRDDTGEEYFANVTVEQLPGRRVTQIDPDTLTDIIRRIRGIMDDESERNVCIYLAIELGYNKAEVRELLGGTIGAERIRQIHQRCAAKVKGVWLNTQRELERLSRLIRDDHTGEIERQIKERIGPNVGPRRVKMFIQHLYGMPIRQIATVYDITPPEARNTLYSLARKFTGWEPAPASITARIVSSPNLRSDLCSI